MLVEVIYREKNLEKLAEVIYREKNGEVRRSYLSKSRKRLNRKNI